MDNPSSSNTSAPTQDQIFLLYMIMGIYFGPDLKDESPKKSALRRIVEGLPPYSSDQLAATCFKAAEVERLYYYVLRNADPSVILPLPVFYQFFHGLFPGSPATYPELNDFYPPHLHRLRLDDNGYNVIENIAFVNDPDVNYIIPGYLQKFKTLAGVQGLFLDGYRVGEIHDHHNRAFAAPSTSNTNSADEDLDHAMLVLPTPPSKEELRDFIGSTKRGCAMTGSAATGEIGPVIGALDIGESEDAYLFRVSLPGVKRDQSDFSCEVEGDGTVNIQGVTTHPEKSVTKFSQVFELQSQNLCTPGHFKMSFKLPGPVDIQHFMGTFGSDGIFEGLILKAQQNGP